jgi:hypothetical protein
MTFLGVVGLFAYLLALFFFRCYFMMQRDGENGVRCPQLLLLEMLWVVAT